MRWIFMVIILLCGGIFAGEQAVSNEIRNVIGNFSKGANRWVYLNGREFPGAQGLMEVDRNVTRKGKPSLRLHGDFSKGGRYVAIRKNLGELPLDGIDFWVKTDGTKSVRFQLVDTTGQCHQSWWFPLKDTTAWQHLAVKVSEICSSEHWGGAKDKKWHNPAQSLTILLDQGTLCEGRKDGTFWFSDIVAMSEKKSPPAPVIGFEQKIHFTGFEENKDAWEGSNGPEFPGAVRKMERDSTVAKEGQASLRLHGDFSKGGAYVSASTYFPAWLRDVRQMEIWMKSDGVNGITILAEDGTGQCHKKRIALQKTSDWQKVTIPFFSMVGGEHWGGVNDGKWHAPARKIALAIERGNVDKEKKTGTLWLDAISLQAILPGVRLGQVKLGNIFLSSESPAFIVTTPEKEVSGITWSIADFRGKEVAKGEQSKNGEFTLSPPFKNLGYFVLTVNAIHKGKTVDSAQTPFAILSDFNARAFKESPFGMGTHFAQRWPLEIIPLLTRAGVIEVRDEICWGDVEKQKGKFVIPEKHDKYMKALKDAGISLDLGLTYGNRNYGKGNAPHTPEMYQAYARYAAELVKCYGKQLRAVEVWNEWNSPGFCRGPAKSSPTVYFEMLKATYDAVKKVDPDMTVLGCSTTGLWWGGYTWLEKFFALPDSLDYCDGISFHPYYCEYGGTGYLPECIKKITSMMKSGSNGNTKPLWVTEIGWPVNDQAKGETGSNQAYMARKRIITEVSHARYVVCNAIELWGCGVKKSYWYDFMNDGVDPRKGEHNFGLIRHPSDPLGKCAPKPAYVAFGVMARQLTGAEFIKHDEFTKQTHSFVFNKSDKEIRVAWTDGPVVLAVRGKGVKTDMMGDEKKLVPINGVAPMAVAAGEPVYFTGNVQKVYTGAWIDLPSIVHASTGSEIGIPYTFTNKFPFEITCTIRLDGKEYPLKAGPISQVKGKIKLPSQEDDELKTLRYSVSSLGTLLIESSVELRIEKIRNKKLAP